MDNSSPIQQRICQKCGQNLLLVNFYKKGPSRYDLWCKPCRRRERNERYKNGSEGLQVVDEGIEALAPPEQYKPYNGASTGFHPKDPHPRVPQYTQDEVDRAVEVFKILIQWRDEDRKKGLIDW